MAATDNDLGDAGPPPPRHLGARRVADPSRVKGPVGYLDLVVVGSVLLIIALTMWPMWDARFGVIDDHEIVTLIGRHPRLPLSQAWATLAHHVFEHNGRFRPLYWLLRVFECLTAGTNVRLWYVDRFFLAGLTAVLLYALLRRVGGPATAALGSIVCFAGPQFEAWTRLGPQETYALPLTLAGIFLVGGALFRPTPRAAVPGLLLLAFAGYVKENFVVILPATILFLIVLRCRLLKSAPSWTFGRRDVVGWCAAAALCLMSVVGVASERLLYGDFYARRQTLAGVLHSIKVIAVTLNAASGWFAVVALAAVLVLWRYRRREELARSALWMGSAVGLVLLPQAALYSDIDITGRYLIPANLFAVAMVLLGLRLIAKASEGSKALRAVVVMLATVGVGAVSLQSLATARRAAVVSSTASRAFQSSLAAVIDRERHYGSTDVIIVVHDVLLDYEPAFSTAEYLAVRDPAPTLYLDVDQGTAGDSLSLRLRQVLNHISQDGGSGFTRLGDLPSGRRCIEIAFRSSAITGTCSNALVINGVR